MKMIKRILYLLVLMLMLAGSMAPASVQAAAGQITLTFRSGDVGNIDVAKATAMIQDNDGVEVRISQNYVKITIDKDKVSNLGDVVKAAFGTSDVDGIFNRITLHQGYSLLLSSKWGFDGAKEVRHNEEFVLDYGKLVEPVMYTIRFYDVNSYDSGSGTYTQEVAAPIINYGNAGDVVDFDSALISNYATAVKSASIVLSKDSDNQYNFFYVYTGSEFDEDNVVFEDVYNYLTQDQVNTVILAAGQGNATANVVAEAMADNALPDEDNAQEAQDDNQGQAAGDDITGDNQDNSDDSVDLQDEDVPLAAQKSSSNTLMIAGGIFALVVVAAVGVILYIRKKGKA